MNIFFVYKDKFASFIQKEIEVLEGHDVDIYRFNGIKRWRDLKEFFRQLRHVVRRMFWTDIYYAFFCDYHCLIPFIFGRLTGRKNIVIVAGYDAITLPEVGYGVFVKRNWRNLIARICYHLAHRIVPVDISLRDAIRDRMPRLFNSRKFHTVPFGFDTDYWKPYPEDIRSNAIILSVGVAMDWTGWYRKGFDRVCSVARLMPEKTFTIVGVMFDLGIYKPDNVIVMGYTPKDELLAMYQSAKIYLQLSRAEGMLNTLGEAMACGCIPIGANTNGIPTLIGDVGYVVDGDSPEQIRMAINDIDRGDLPGFQREWIRYSFNETQRRVRITNILNRL